MLEHPLVHAHEVRAPPHLELVDLGVVHLTERGDRPPAGPPLGAVS